ncbi:MAG: ArsR family transcriptional regulator [Acidithiobacillus sp.]
MIKLNSQDRDRVLQCLQDGPKTVHEMALLLRLSQPRISSLLPELNRRGLIHAPRCKVGPRGNTVNLWDLPIPQETPL